MNVMDTRSRIRTKAWVKGHLVVVRRPDVPHLECDTCGCPALTQRELADVLGVKLTALSGFMHGRSLRPDIAARIRDGVKEVRQS